MCFSENILAHIRNTSDSMCIAKQNLDRRTLLEYGKKKTIHQDWRESDTPDGGSCANLVLPISLIDVRNLKQIMYPKI